ncbi:MAG: carboxysome shell carbonic anhydrase [Gammaproteobacteria bacterium]|nr:carboxysome shell carbonic anhydrase [Gammaproteobacteria bacterium]
MLRSSRQSAFASRRTTGRAPLRRPGAVGSAGGGGVGSHPLCRVDENAQLHAYERTVKDAFDGIVPILKEISALQHEADFVGQAQRIARQKLGFELPVEILEGAWVEQLDMRRLFAWCVFQTYRRFCDDFFANDPLASADATGFDAFLQACGFHTFDISPCADGRLAHVVRYVLRLPHRSVRRKSYAGALFDIENSIEKWVETEMLRYREGRPNLADAPTRYLKAVVYHYSSVDPEHEGCAAHGSDTQKAAQAGLDRLNGFREAVENSFCCGASIDLLLVGLDTDTDAIRVHLPDGEGDLSLDRYVDALELYRDTRSMSAGEAIATVTAALQGAAPESAEGMQQLVAKLLENNISQIVYVKNAHGEHYPDIGHAERFIGAGVGFEEIQLRNLMYFAYLNTVEEATPDTDVGIKIFRGLNVAHGLPVPIVVRFDYHSKVPGARDRAVKRCARVAGALTARYAELAEKGLLHILQLVRDCTADSAVEVLACTVNAGGQAGTH